MATYRPVFVLALILVAGPVSRPSYAAHDYSDALHKSILFFEGQRSGKLPHNQRLTWRRDSALHDGAQDGVDLTGGYYDAGDNIKFGFPMAFTATLMAWGIIDFGKNMGPHLNDALTALRWATDYLLKTTATPNVVYVQVGDAFRDHSCWERPEDMAPRRCIGRRKSSGFGCSRRDRGGAGRASIVFRYGIRRIPGFCSSGR
ncbi:uncharacterized protein A4U43_C06F5310 [Asparagus officinalis]|uniref:cellulase n=1 Tax=Asparagus officinalis TaxID=4686 RepID=A0A5P1EK94_ASPOF|nr:uncharacterized protein A4U43_C06F5310 [Asparagus officinalis]